MAKRTKINIQEHSAMGSDLPKTLYLRGKVFSGKSEGEKFIRLPWVKEQIAKKIGFIPYPGTLNIKLEETSAKLQLLKKTKALEISPAAGFCRGKCLKAYLIDNVECAIVIPEIANYPEDVLEVIAPINLRDKLSLKNGDTVEIKITF